MSKRLLIWIGLIILVGVISAAGWSVFVTVNRDATEAPPPVTGKIPQIPQPPSATTADQAPAAPAQGQSTTAAAEQKPLAAITRTTSDPQPKKADPAPADPSAEGSPLTPQAQPAPTPEEPALSQPPAAPVDAIDSEAPESPEPPAATSEAPAAPETAPESENKAAQHEGVPEKMSDSSTSGKMPATALSAAPEPPAKAQFTIQAGSYRDKQNAENFMSELSGKGYDAYVHEVTDATSPAWFAVRFGRFPTFATAQQALSAYQEKEQQKAVIIRSDGR
jgi:septal ring-binding cell division protein DamX